MINVTNFEFLKLLKDNDYDGFRMPSNLTVIGDLYLYNLSMYSVYDKLSVDGGLLILLNNEILGHKSPIDIHISKIILINCSKIHTLPRNLTVKGNLFLCFDNPNIVIPDNIISNNTYIRIDNISYLNKINKNYNLFQTNLINFIKYPYA
jgi:hypothetical protein